MKPYPLTPAQFNALRTKLLSLGIAIPSGTDGTIGPVSGVELGYHYDPAAGILTLKILKKPFIAPSAMIWEKVDGWLASLGGP